MTKPYIIAEVASAHEGRPELALKIAKYAVKSGADAIKFQVFNRDQLLTRTNPYFDEFGEIEISSKKWIYLLEQISIENIDIIVEPYDLESLQLAVQSGYVQGYKIPSANLGDSDLLKAALNTRKPLYLGVGGAEWGEIEQVISLLKGVDYTLICGFQSFPTKLRDSNLFQIPQIKDFFGCSVGYADHVDAENHEMARIVPALAVSMGAKVIEKHITDDRSRKGKDHYSALNPEEFKSFVTLIGNLPNIIGEETEWSLSEAEMNYRKFAKRQAVAGREIAAGTKLGLIDIAFKRTNEEGLSHQCITKYFGRKFARSKKNDDPLTPEDFVES